MDAVDTVTIYFKPDWPSELTSLMGQIIGQEGYITPVGTVHLTGQTYGNPNIPKTRNESPINGPTLILSAKSSLGFA